jgi:CheY-like chemotaxis protein
MVTEANKPGNDRLRVLVVDDEADIRETLCMVLRLHGLEAVPAPDGPTALEMVARFHPEAVLVDLGMPRMSGLELAKRLRLSCPGLLLVAVTAWGSEEDRRQTADAGFDCHLVKPAPLAPLLDLLATIPPHVH